MVQPHLQSFEHIGPAIRRLREARGLRQSDLADKVRMNRASLSRVENGRVQPKLETVKKVLEALDVGEMELTRTIEGIRREKGAREEPGRPGEVVLSGDRYSSKGALITGKLREYLLLLEFLNATTKGEGEAWVEDMQSFVDQVRRMAPTLLEIVETMRRLEPAKDSAEVNPQILNELKRFLGER